MKTASGYTENVLYSFSGGTTDGAYPDAGLIADANGDLFGTTLAGGRVRLGTVFELVKTASGYTEKVIYSFTGYSTDGLSPGRLDRRRQWRPVRHDLFGRHER